MIKKHNFSKFLISSLFASSLLFANSDNPVNNEQKITLDWLNTKPRSITKDFYVWQFLQQDITPNEAMTAFGEINRVTNQLLKLYAKKINHDETYAIIQCMEASGQDLLNTNADCINIGLSANKTTKLNYIQKNQAFEIVKNKYPKQAEIISILNASLPFTKLLAAKPEIFFDIFNSVNLSYINEHFNYKIPPKILDKLATSKKFNLTIKRIITDSNLRTLQESFLTPFNTENLTSESLFFLGLNALKHKNSELAINYLEDSKSKAYLKKDKDKTNFWLYQITQKNELLEELSNSYDINIYSLYAKEKLNKKIDNIFYDIPIPKDAKQTSIDITDPFVWIEVINNKNYSTDDLKTLFSTKETLPHLAYILERESKSKKFYYITPFKEQLKNYDIKRQALIYALGKKESYFISGSVSSAYALGIMQIMPFLSKAIAKELNEEYFIDEQFSPNVNLKYANHHLNYLEKNLLSPLFIAYAYNGGIGFTRRMLQKQKGFVEKNDPYEPMLSMELMSNTESREYGKQVLANYYIYINHLDKKNHIKLSTLLQSLEHNFPK